ncbi:dihydroxyacetone kinase DhaL subunit [Rivularia sp. PCC 7116]|uniref:dihydroxyacetone kinase subunit DhaL n=1 Tax=Rivularia sp. PCC 7116 TaxID=373994 RepID=UPI00029F4D27|nr:dihydroxyacetone kinase DhaL subunit [Rivularia sp. PCC 7116]
MQKQTIINWLQKFASEIEQNKDYLTELDAAIGDADHGINMQRGFKKVIEKLPTVADKDIGTILKTVSMTLISSIGGASGPLYGTFFLRASTAVAGKQELDAENILELLKTGLDGIIARGKTQLGDKTMVDSLHPAVMAFEQAINDGADVKNAVEKAVAAAEQGMKETIPMVAKKGRASYLGERSKGHQDPGATSVYLMLKSLQESLI